MVRSFSSPIEQRETHRHLAGRARAPRGSRGAPLDAIIVPAARPADNLGHAAALARAVNCQLVVLCSRQAAAADVSEWLAGRNVSRATIVDVPDGYHHELLRLRSSELIGGELPAMTGNPNGDLSVKRNIGLLLARMLKWPRIFFMDDDIRHVSPDDLQATAGMLGYYRSAGMRITDYPDNSVVCHAHRQTGAPQDVFVGGSVLAVSCPEGTGFFPEIYNEDWLFFYDDAREKRLGWSGRNARQLRYDPFDMPERAEQQEFGDVLAEGLYALLDHGAGATVADRQYWKIFLDARWRFLGNLIDRSWRAAEDQQVKIISAAQTAMLCLMQIQPKLCERYVGAWRDDLRAWTEKLASVPDAASIDAALAQLGLRAAETQRRGRSRRAAAGRNYVVTAVPADAQPAQYPRLSHKAPPAIK